MSTISNYDVPDYVYLICFKRRQFTSDGVFFRNLENYLATQVCTFLRSRGLHESVILRFQVEKVLIRNIRLSL